MHKTPKTSKIEIAMGSSLRRFMKESERQLTDISKNNNHGILGSYEKKHWIHYDHDGFFILNIGPYEQLGRIDVGTGELLWGCELNLEKCTIVSVRGTKQPPKRGTDVFSLEAMAAARITRIADRIMRPEHRISGREAYTDGVWVIFKGEDEHTLTRVGTEIEVPFQYGKRPSADLESLLTICILHDNY